jgi:lipopolysaccharide/colanic/teichoic acid biosynthesis glycosyltransferase
MITHAVISRRRSTAKAAIDICGAAVLLVLLSPLFIVVTLLVLLIDGPPLIYKRRVVGQSGEFDAYKFRTMQNNADCVLAADEALRTAFRTTFKLRNDPRVTRMGAILRKFSLDELPQLVNVIRGQMSLVGPRMITAPELEKYGDYKQLLLTVKPGLTGHWQVHGRQRVSYAERVRMDVEYIVTWTLRKDIELLLLTPWQVLRGKGAY